MKSRIILALYILFIPLTLSACSESISSASTFRMVAAEARDWQYASELDKNGGWLTDQEISEAVGKNIIGTSNRNELRLSDMTTRAEMLNMINRGLGLTEMGKNRFKDVKKSDWFYNDYCLAYYYTGFSDDTARPNDTITRAEVAVIIARVLELEPDYRPIYEFIDQDKIPTWACYGVGSCIKAGIYMGFPDKTFRPNDCISRAEAVKLVSNVVERHAARKE